MTDIEWIFDRTTALVLTKAFLEGEHEYLSQREIFRSAEYSKSGFSEAELGEQLHAYQSLPILKKRVEGGTEKYALHTSPLILYGQCSRYAFPFDLNTLLAYPYSGGRFWLFRAARVPNPVSYEQTLAELADWAETSREQAEAEVTDIARACWQEYAWKCYRQWNPGIGGVAIKRFLAFDCPDCPDPAGFLPRILRLCGKGFMLEEAEELLWGIPDPIYTCTFADGISFNLRDLRMLISNYLGFSPIDAELMRRGIFQVISNPIIWGDPDIFNTFPYSGMRRAVERAWKVHLKLHGLKKIKCPFDAGTFTAAVIGAMRDNPDRTELAAGAWHLLLRADLDRAREALYRQSLFDWNRDGTRKGH